MIGCRVREIAHNFYYVCVGGGGRGAGGREGYSGGGGREVEGGRLLCLAFYENMAKRFT